MKKMTNQEMMNVNGGVNARKVGAITCAATFLALSAAASACPPASIGIGVYGLVACSFF